MAEDLFNFAAEEELPPRYTLPRETSLPPIVRELVSNAPESFKVPTFFAAITCLAAIATRLRAYYPFDSDPHAIMSFPSFCTINSPAL